MSQDQLQSLCQTAQALHLGTGYEISNSMKTVASAVSLPIIAYLVFTKKILIYQEFHFMVLFKIFALTAFSVNNTVVHALQLYDRLFNPSQPCEWVRTAATCIGFKAIHFAMSSAISTTLFFIIFETLLSVLIFPNKLRAQNITSMVLLIIQILSTIFITVKTWTIDSNSQTLLLHCLEDTPTILPFANDLSLMIVVLDVFTVLGSIFLKIYLSACLKKKNLLERSFQLRHASLIINSFIPLIAYHASTLLLFNIGSIILRNNLQYMDKVTTKNFAGFLNILPYYTLVCPLLLKFVMNRLKSGRTNEFNESVQPRLNGKVVPEGTFYHETLHKQWN